MRTSVRSPDVVVIGAGAAGLMCALTAAARGREVLLIEHANKPGKKIKSLNNFHFTENNNIVIESAKGIGCSVVNIGSGDIIEVREHLILGLIWQVIRRGLLGKIDIKLHPELYRLLEDDETLEQFLRLPPEQILLRWFNYHLKNAKWPRK